MLNFSTHDNLQLEKYVVEQSASFRYFGGTSYYFIVRYFNIESSGCKMQNARKCGPDFKNCAFELCCFLRIIGNLMIYVKETRKSSGIKQAHKIYRDSGRFKKYRGNSVGPQRMEYSDCV